MSGLQFLFYFAHLVVTDLAVRRRRRVQHGGRLARRAEREGGGRPGPLDTDGDEEEGRRERCRDAEPKHELAGAELVDMP